MRRKITAKIIKNIPQPVWDVFKTFTDSGHEIYLVGGGVRNLLLGKNPVDCDFTTNAVPEIIKAFYDNSFCDNVFGTVGIPIKTEQGDEIYEITTYRSEGSYSDSRRPDEVKWERSLTEDLKRREFTFNAVVIGPILKKSKWDGKALELIDPFNGRQDFKNKLVRAVGNPELRLQEDALRMMRAVRFAAQLGFQIEKQTFNAIKGNADSVKLISP